MLEKTSRYLRRYFLQTTEISITISKHIELYINLNKLSYYYHGLPFSPAPHLVSDVFEVCLEVLLGAVEEPLRLEVSGTEGQEVDGRESGLLARGDKDDDGCLWGVLADGLVDWLHHGNES